MEAGRWLDIKHRLQKMTFSGNPYFGIVLPFIKSFLLYLQIQLICEIFIYFDTFQSAPLRVKLTRKDVTFLKAGTKFDLPIRRIRKNQIAR
jgi:hypothetical protein